MIHISVRKTKVTGAIPVQMMSSILITRVSINTTCLVREVLTIAKMKARRTKGWTYSMRTHQTTRLKPQRHPAISIATYSPFSSSVSAIARPRGTH
jgi:hypothetical protein